MWQAGKQFLTQAAPGLRDGSGAEEVSSDVLWNFSKRRARLAAVLAGATCFSLITDMVAIVTEKIDSTPTTPREQLLVAIDTGLAVIASISTTSYGRSAVRSGQRAAAAEVKELIEAQTLVSSCDVSLPPPVAGE